MRRTGLLIGGWAVATVLALMVGLLGVRAVSNSVTTHRPPPLSPASVRAALTSSSSSEATESDPPETTSPDSSSTDAVESVESSSSGSQGSVSSQEQNEASSSSENTDSHGSNESSSSAAVAPPEDRTYQLVGGSVGVRFENNAAELLWATPNTGFSVESNGDSSSVDVRFRNDSHESRLKAFWDNGPQQEIEEKN